MEENKQINLANFTLVELKAISYDEIVNLNLAQNNLRALNQELYNRQQKGVEDAAPVTQN
jgi:hypothetical protein